ncbi:MAG TPA: DUF481 domain-containing protein [Polyangiaceae bacterium]|nr:DUF481 domain-containing protein [Polyangiaceae bacterium]
MPTRGPALLRLAPFLGTLLLVALGAPRGAAAQVNVEGLRKALTKPGVHGSLSGSLTTYQGNTMGSELGGTGLIGYREERQLVYLSTNANYSRLGGEARVANAFAHFRYNYLLSARVAAEAFTQVESDRFRRLRLRSLVGIGPRFTLVDGEGGALFYGVSYMYVHTTLGDSVADRPVRPADVHRMNNYVALLLVLEPGRAALGNTLYFQPRFDDLRDIQLLDVLSLDVTITGRLSASLQGTLRYETPVPEPIKRTDLMVKNLIGVTF